MAPRKPALTPEERTATGRAEIKAWAKTHPEFIPDYITYDGKPGHCTGGQTWEGRARMAQARLAVGSFLNDLDREALRRAGLDVPDRVAVPAPREPNEVPDPRPPLERPPVNAPQTSTGRHHPQTSVDAANRTWPTSGSDAEKVFRFILEQGDHGATDDEIEVALEMSHQTCSARRRGLAMNQWVVASGRRRKTRTNSDAIVWVAVP